MINKIQFPVFVCEVETENVEVYFNANELRLIVEEFWDILEEDFKIWDKDGFSLRFDHSFLNGEDKAIRSMKNDEQSLKSCLIRYAAKKGLHIENKDRSSLLDILKFLWGSGPNLDH